MRLTQRADICVQKERRVTHESTLDPIIITQPDDYILFKKLIIIATLWDYPVIPVTA